VPARHGELESVAAEAVKSVEASFRQNSLQAALEQTWALITRANQYVEQTAPFKLAKDPAQAGRLDEVLYNLAESCRIIAVLISPVVPTTAAKIYDQLGLGPLPGRFAEATWGGLTPGSVIREPTALFPRKDPAK
jgi:methionyl-tRNA synthetase